MRLGATLLVLAMSPALGDRFDHTHQGFDRFLSYVVVVSSDGASNRVDYSLASKEEALLEAYLSVLASVSEEEFLQFSEANQTAFLINAYNAAMIQKILQRYPDIESVWDFGRIFNHPFKDRFVKLFGERLSLDDIEHGFTHFQLHITVWLVDVSASTQELGVADDNDLMWMHPNTPAEVGLAAPVGKLLTGLAEKTNR